METKEYYSIPLGINETDIRNETDISILREWDLKMVAQKQSVNSRIRNAKIQYDSGRFVDPEESAKTNWFKEVNFRIHSLILLKLKEAASLEKLERIKKHEKAQEHYNNSFLNFICKKLGKDPIAEYRKEYELLIK